MKNCDVLNLSTIVYLVYLKPFDPKKLFYWVWLSAASFVNAPKAVLPAVTGGTTTVTFVGLMFFTVQA